MHPLKTNRIITGNRPRTGPRLSVEEASSPCLFYPLGSGNHRFPSPLAGKGKGEGAHHHAPSPSSPRVKGRATDPPPVEAGKPVTKAPVEGGETRGLLLSSLASQGAAMHDVFARYGKCPRSRRTRQYTTFLLLFFLSSLLVHVVPGPAAHAYMDTERSVKLDAPFLPTPNYVIAELLAKVRVGKDDILYDLGSGDGRIVIEAARQTGCRAVGIEIDADLVDDSRKAALRAGVQDRVRFIVADIFTEDFSEATVVTIYMGGHVNLKLRPKLLRELRPGTRIASYSFDMGEWKPDAVSTFGKEDAYFWVIPANASGKWQWTEGSGKSKTTWELEVSQVFQEVSGRISFKGKQYPLQAGKMNGEEIRFTLSGEAFGKSALVEFSGRVRGHAIEGTIDDSATRRVWKATRNPATVQPIAK